MNVRDYKKFFANLDEKYDDLPVVFGVEQDDVELTVLKDKGMVFKKVLLEPIDDQRVRISSKQSIDEDEICGGCQHSANCSNCTEEIRNKDIESLYNNTFDYCKDKNLEDHIAYIKKCQRAIAIHHNK